MIENYIYSALYIEYLYNFSHSGCKKTQIFEQNDYVVKVDAGIIADSRNQSSPISVTDFSRMQRVFCYFMLSNFFFLAIQRLCLCSSKCQEERLIHL